MSQPPQLRPARKDDCTTIARLYSISSDGVADYIWESLAEAGENRLHFGQRRYEREGTDFSYQNCVMVERDNETLGMIVAFPIHVDPSYVESDPVLAPYCKLEEDNSYYICGVAIFPEFRNQGLGSLLMEHAERTAKTRGYAKLSLIVFAENTGAKKLYERIGYTEVMREPIVPHPLIRMTGDAILMVKHL